ncbi:hypothetical protein GALMADRAFT_1294057 [Galerina marginata CBS 339.88]|uniref:Uncharacterized protein n=1 Tax=Galerina marginata (strain CBS 339.88) TaxID=685588 RepID=A0A067TDF9_GALM3|nr:hypothetical protein GALMADRAFT_1294057 [Galerina marginata CBS 339.88]
MFLETSVHRIMQFSLTVLICLAGFLPVQVFSSPLENRQLNGDMCIFFQPNQPAACFQDCRTCCAAHPTFPECAGGTCVSDCRGL